MNVSSQVRGSLNGRSARMHVPLPQVSSGSHRALHASPQVLGDSAGDTDTEREGSTSLSTDWREGSQTGATDQRSTPTSLPEKMESRKRRAASAERSGSRPDDRSPNWESFHRISELFGWPQTFVGNVCQSAAVDRLSGQGSSGSTARTYTACGLAYRTIASRRMLAGMLNARWSIFSTAARGAL